MSINPYNNMYNKYSFSIDELNYIDESWNVINKFSSSYLTKIELRENIILFVSSTYTPEQFDKLEIIIEKMYWNMIEIVKNILKQSYIENKVYYKFTPNKKKQLRKIYKKNRELSESYVDKILLHLDSQILYKYDYPNNFDLIISSLIINRNTYETIYNNINVLNIELIKNLISGENIRESIDYMFPNINSIKPFWYQNRMERIIEYYYK